MNNEFRRVFKLVIAYIKFGRYLAQIFVKRWGIQSVIIGVSSISSLICEQRIKYDYLFISHPSQSNTCQFHEKYTTHWNLPSKSALFRLL
jgi:hypothetical protein